MKIDRLQQIADEINNLLVEYEQIVKIEELKTSERYILSPECSINRIVQRIEAIRNCETGITNTRVYFKKEKLSCQYS